MAAGRYRLMTMGQAVGSGVSGGWRFGISSVAKPNSDNAPYCIPNELICANVGRFLYLPIPPGGVIDAPNTAEKIWYGSMDFNITGNTLPPIDPDACVRFLPDLATGLCLFDVLIANSDRHTQNISVDDRTRPSTMSVFDHSHAFFGATAGQGAQHLLGSQGQLAVSGHCLLGIIRSDASFEKWLRRIEAIPDFFIEEACREAIDLGIDTGEADAAIEFLKRRRDGIRELVSANSTLFTSITQWSLPL